MQLLLHKHFATFATLIFAALLAPHPALSRAEWDQKTRLAAPRVQIPIAHSSRHITIDVWIDSRGPFPFLLDTGASGHGAIDQSLARELGLEVADHVRMEDGTGLNSQTAPRYDAVRLELSGVSFAPVFLVGGDFASIYSKREHWTSRQPRGLLGLGLFEDFLLTIDYPGSRIELTRGQLDRSDVEVFPYQAKDGLAYAEIRVGSTRLRACVDTGSQGELTLPLPYLGKLPTLFEPVLVGNGRTTNNHYEILSTVLRDPIEIGPAKVEHPKVFFNELFQGAILGYGFLQGFRITFDQQGELLSLQTRPSSNGSTGPSPLGIQTRPRRGWPQIIALEPGSAGRKSDLEIGDIILRVRGQHVLDLVRRGRFHDSLNFDEEETLRMIVRRGSFNLEVEIEGVQDEDPAAWSILHPPRKPSE